MPKLCLNFSVVFIMQINSFPFSLTCVINKYIQIIAWLKMQREQCAGTHARVCLCICECAYVCVCLLFSFHCTTRKPSEECARWLEPVLDIVALYRQILLAYQHNIVLCASKRPPRGSSRAIVQTYSTLN